mgnify:CR=1 FL=1
MEKNVLYLHKNTYINYMYNTVQFFEIFCDSDFLCQYTVHFCTWYIPGTKMYCILTQLLLYALKRFFRESFQSKSFTVHFPLNSYVENANCETFGLKSTKSTHLLNSLFGKQCCNNSTIWWHKMVL